MNDYTGTARSPAQAYAVLFGAVLTVVGIVGFFYNSDFTSNVHDRDAILGIFAVNGWHNVLHIVTGACGLLMASTYSGGRTCALGLGIVYLALAIWGFAIGGGHSLLSIIPVNTGDNVLHLLIGIAGIAAGMATPAVADPTTRPATA